MAALDTGARRGRAVARSSSPLAEGHRWSCTHPAPTSTWDVACLLPDNSGTCSRPRDRHPRRAGAGRRGGLPRVRRCWNEPSVDEELRALGMRGRLPFPEPSRSARADESPHTRVWLIMETSPPRSLQISRCQSNGRLPRNGGTPVFSISLQGTSDTAPRTGRPEVRSSETVPDVRVTAAGDPLTHREPYPTCGPQNG
jgi:hypothetical protein